MKNGRKRELGNKIPKRNWGTVLVSVLVFVLVSVSASVPVSVLVFSFVVVLFKREVEYRIPRLHSPVNSRRFPEISVRSKQASCRLSWRTVLPRFSPLIL